MENKKKAVVYARYSSQNQREESISRQIESIETFCEQNHFTITEYYIDEAQSGTNDQRDQFKKMINDAPYSDWDFIVVYKLDRLSRNVSDAMHYKKQMNQLGIRILSVIEDFDEATPEGGFFNLITMGISEFYSKNLAREAFAGQLQNAKRAMHTGGTQPLGYDYGKDLKIIINEHEAKAVRIIFQKVLEGWSYRAISELLNQNNFKTKKGNPFKGAFTDILTNRKYIGEFVYNRTAKKHVDGSRNHHKSKPENEIVRIPNALPPIIDKATFDQVQLMLKKRANDNAYMGPKAKYLLSGLIVCEHCGYKVSGNLGYSGRNKRPRTSYRCKTKKDPNVCKLKDINTKYLDQVVLNTVQAMLNQNEAGKLKTIINEKLKALKINLNKEIQEINQTIDSKQQMIDQLSTKLAKSSSSVSKIINEQINENVDEIDKLKVSLKEKENDFNSIQPVYIKTIKEKQKQYKETLKGKAKKQVLYKLIKKIVQGNENVEIQLRLNVFLIYELEEDLIKSVLMNRDKISSNEFKSIWHSRNTINGNY